MKTPAKVWLWIMLVANAIVLLRNFTSVVTAWVVIAETLVILAAVVMMLFLQMKAGFYLLCVFTVLDCFYSVSVLPMLILYLLIGNALKVGITWLCIRSSWSEMK